MESARPKVVVMLLYPVIAIGAATVRVKTTVKVAPTVSVTVTVSLYVPEVKTLSIVSAPVDEFTDTWLVSPVSAKLFVPVPPEIDIEEKV